MIKVRRTSLQNLFIRNLEGEKLLDIFLVTTVGTILSIRLFLSLTDYPQIGNAYLHIDHMLWGGLLMLLSLILSFLFLNREIRNAAVVIGGIGFGLFIDELGKLVTRNDDYLFQPAIALIYMILVLLYLLFRSLGRLRPPTEQEYLINAIESVKEAAENKLDIQEKLEAIELLERGVKENPLAESVIEVLEEIPANPVLKSSRIFRISFFCQSLYRRLLRTKWFLKAVLIVFLSKAGFSLGSIALQLSRSSLGIIDWAEISSRLVALLLIAFGVFYLRRSRAQTYQFFKYSVLVSLFLTQFFAFYRDQLSALSEFFANLLFLAVLDYMLDQENLLNQERKRLPKKETPRKVKPS